MTGFLKSTGVYLLGSVLSKAIWVVLLPLYTNVVDPVDYGTYDVVVAFVVLLSSVVYIEIWNAILRFMFDYTEEGEKRAPVVAGLGIFGASTAIFSVTLLIAGALWPIEHIGFVLCYGLLTNISNVSGYIARGYGKSITFMLSGVLGSLVTIACNLIFLLALKMGYQAMYLSFAIGYLVTALINIFGAGLIGRLRGARPDRALMRAMLRYALPLSVNAIAYWLLTSYNKFVINWQLGAYENGMYAVASKFGIMITLFTQAFQLAWSELSFARAGEEREALGTFYSQAMNEYIRFMTLGLMLLLPAIRIAFPLLVSDTYAGAADIVPLYMAATLLLVFCEFMTSMFMAIKDTKVILYATAAGAIVNIACVHLLIGPLGIQGANVGLFAGLGVNLIVRVVSMRRQVGLQLKWQYFAIAAAGVALACAVFLWGNLWACAAAIVCTGALALWVYRRYLPRHSKKEG